MLLLLLKAGADIDGKTNSNETALHKAARWNRREIAIALLKRGAKIEIKNGDGNKAADMTTEQWMKDLINHFEEFLANEKIEKMKKSVAKTELEQKLAERKKEFGY
jgi:ankyrin repeat protein